MSVEKTLLLNDELEVVQYPGMVQNVEKMISTLGGIKRISQAFETEEKKLQICFHPQNPFNKGATAEQNKNFGILLHVKLRRKKNNSKELSQKWNVQIMGHCTKMFSFNNLCDFQYLPLTVETNPDTCFLKSIVPQSISQFNYFDYANVPMYCCPKIFARSDTVNLNSLRMSYLIDDGQQEQLGLLHRSSYDNRRNIVFNMVDPLPTEADVKIMKRMKIKYVTDEQLHIVKKLFEKCPIWTRLALLHESGLSIEKLKYITPSLAYYFSTGPWRTLYVRYGHDPRRDFKSRYYQTFDYRLRFRSGMSSFVSNRADKKKSGNNLEQEGSVTQNIDYPYLDEQKLPRSRHCIWRYCDIRIAKVQEMLDKIPKPITETICNERTGWLPVGFDVEVRRVVNASVRDVLRTTYMNNTMEGDEDDMNEKNDDGEFCDVDDEEETVRVEQFIEEGSLDNDDEIKNMMERLDSE